MTRRLSLAGQLLALQVVIICVVLVGVTAVTVAQSTQRAQEFEGRRAQAVAETLAELPGARAVDAGRPELAAYVRVAAETTRSNSGSASVVVADADRTVLASADPAELATGATTSATARCSSGRGWIGERHVDGTPGRGGDGADPDRPPAGDRRLRRRRAALPVGPGRAGGGGAQPAHLPRAGQRDRHRRLAAGGPPGEAADPRPGAARDRRPGRAPRRDAARHPRGRGRRWTCAGRVTLINDEAIRLLHIPGDALGRTLDELGVGEEMRDALLAGDGRARTARWPAPGGCWWSTGCRSPAAAGRSAR